MLFQAITFGITFYCFTLYVNEWLADPLIEVTRAQAMLANSALLVAAGAVSPLIGPFMDRYSIRTLICLGVLAAATGMALVSIATAFWQILAIYGALISFCIVLSGPLAAQTLVVKWFDGRRGTAMGIVTTGTSIGGFTVPLLVSYLFTEVGWRTTNLIIAAAMVLLVIPPVLLLIRNNPAQLGLEPDPPALGTGQEGSLPVVPRTRHWSTKTIVTEPNFWVICGVIVLLSAGFTAIASNLGPFATDHGVAKVNQGILIAIYAGIMIPAKMLFGYFSTRMDVRVLLWIAMVMLAVSASLFLAANSFTMLALGCLTLGMSSGSILPLMGALVSTRFGTHAFGRVMGMLGPLNALSSLGPIAVGRIRDATGSYDLGWISLLFSLIPAALLAWFLDRIGRSRRDLPSALSRK